jgi:hypothetical protein
MGMTEEEKGRDFGAINGLAKELRDLGFTCYDTADSSGAYGIMSYACCNKNRNLQIENVRHIGRYKIRYGQKFLQSGLTDLDLEFLSAQEAARYCIEKLKHMMNPSFCEDDDIEDMSLYQAKIEIKRLRNQIRGLGHKPL